MKNLYFVVLCCLLGFTTSCSDDDNATALLQIDPSTDLVFEAVGGTKAIEVKTDQTTWSVESNQTWCKVEFHNLRFLLSFSSLPSGTQASALPLL